MKISEKILRQLTLRFISKKYDCSVNFRIVEELGLSFGFNRIDIAVINGKLIGFEIKSDFDDLKRLPDQIMMYEKYFDEIWVVTTSKHLSGVRNIIPNCCGILIASDISTLRMVRTAKINRNSISADLLKLIWKEEARTILINNKISFGSNLPKEKLYEIIQSNLEVKKIKSIVREILINRQLWRSA